jgi:ribosomal protein S18 acetylase RimI-like enzyme
MLGDTMETATATIALYGPPGHEMKSAGRETMAASRPVPKIIPRFRRATPEDAGALAKFVEFASEGLALYLWTKIAGIGDDPWAIGRERLLSGAGGLSFKNGVLAELSGQPAAGLISYALPDTPEHISDELPAMLVPLHELTNLALGTLYVHVLAVWPEYRSRGLGSALLAVADDLAASARKSGLSLIVSDTNDGARKLYESCGYREVARCKMVKERWQHPGTAWVLLRKNL